MTYDEAVRLALALIRQAVYVQRAHISAIRNPGDRPDRLPPLDLEAWYGRAGEVVDVLDRAPRPAIPQTDELMVGWMADLDTEP